MNSNELTETERQILEAFRAGQLAAPAAQLREEVSIDTKWATVVKTCPKCNHVGTVAADFGVRVVRGVERQQSWCMACRASTSYYHTKRKNRTANAA